MALKRQAIAHIHLTEADVIALYAGLVKGWRKELREKRKAGRDR